MDSQGAARFNQILGAKSTAEFADFRRFLAKTPILVGHS
jgi:hypothetical protein